MDIVGNAINSEYRRKGEEYTFKVRTIRKSEWVPEEEREGMRDEMESRIRINGSYRARSELRARDIFSD